jgi:heme exporter protein B
MLLMRLSGLAFTDVFQSGLVSIVLLLACFDILVVLLSVILFPFLWKD